ncbi:MAG: SPFH domain-containing protein [Candidatus Thermoplasmatota archaeon]|nr:SPFH domain-containing protein [Candidatus Thermoplasmatota archaeon]
MVFLFRKSDIPKADARATFHWEDAWKGENVMYRIPRNIQWNDNVVVREDEYAVFFRDGKAMHVFDRPGRFAMTTENVPVLGRLVAAVTGIQQLGEIYYLQRRELRSKFGTAEPLAFRDPDFGLVRIRAFGDFAYKVVDPLLFITQFVGTERITSSDKVIEWMKAQLVMCLNDALGELKRDKNMAVVDMPAYLQEIEQIVLSKVADSVERYGVKIAKIAGLNINLPKEVQEAIDKRGAMGALGVDYIRYQTGKAIEGVGVGAATGAGDATGAMAGLGAGAGVGLGIGAMMGQAMQQPAQVPQPPKPTIKCPKCNADVPEGVKFCPNCGAKMLAPGMMSCPKCNTDIKVGSKFCPSCGEKLVNNCPKCNAELQAGAKFCPNCGSKIE